MKQKLFKSWLLMMCLLFGVGASWADNFSTTYSYGLSGWSLTNYTDQSSYYQVPSGSDPSVATISGIFSGKTITSNVVVTINCATYGSGTSPSASTFSLYKETACKNAITATQGGTLPTSSTYTNVTYTITQANTASLGNDLAIKITKPGKTIRLKSIKVEFTYTTSGGTSTPTTYTVTVANNIANGTVTANPTSAASGATVTLTATPVTGYEFASWNVINASTSEAITVTDNKFTMPASNVNVSATFNQIQGRPENEIFYESFDTNDGTGGNDDKWSGSIASSDLNTDNEGWTGNNHKGAKACAKVGTGSSLGNLITPALGQACDATLTFKAAAWNGSSESTTLKLSVEGGGTITPTTVTMTKGAWKTYTANLKGLTANSKVKFEGNNKSNSRFFLDEVSIVKTGEATPEKTLSSIAVSGTPAEFWKGDAFNHNGITVTATYEDDNTADVTSAAEFSGYNMSKAGKQTVTVTYQEKTATYEIEVKTIANTQETAYTTAQAKALIDAGKDLETEVYVTGVVSKVDKFDETHKSITYWLDDNSFEVYGGLAAEGKEFSSENDIEVGAKVVVLGKITKYNSTYELNSKSHLVSYEAPGTGGTINFEATTGDGKYYATFSSDRAIKFDEAFINDNETCAASIKAYAVAVIDGQICRTDQYEVNNDGNYTYVPANTGILFEYSLEEGTFDGAVPYEYADAEGEYLNDVKDNMLVPCTETATFKAEADGNYYYKLAYGDYDNKTKLGFWLGAEDGSGNFKVKAGGAILRVPQKSNGAKFSGFVFEEDDANAINISVLDKTAPIYNMAGQRVNASAKGVLIQNGKKFIIK